MGKSISCREFGALVKTPGEDVPTIILHGDQESRLRQQLMNDALLPGAYAIGLSHMIYSHFRAAANDRHLKIVIDMTSGLTDIELDTLFRTLQMSLVHVSQLILVHDHDYFKPEPYENSRLSLAQLTTTDKVSSLIIHDVAITGELNGTDSFAAILVGCGGSEEKYVSGWDAYSSFIATMPVYNPMMLWQQNPVINVMELDPPVLPGFRGA